MSEYNNQKMTLIADDIIRALKICLKNKETWKSDKQTMLQLIKMDNPLFYEQYPRICRIVVNEDDITPLLGMISTFAQVQVGNMSLTKANDMISGALNAKYVDPILNSDKLVKERDEKIIEINDCN